MTKAINTAKTQFHTNHSVPIFTKILSNSKFYNKKEPGRNIAKWLFSEAKVSKEMLSFNLFRALFLQHDPTFYREFRDGLQEILNNVFYHLKNNDYHNLFNQNTRDLQFDALMTAVTAMIAYTEMDENTTVKIPQIINKQWLMIEYKVEPIQLTSSVLGSPYYAYGLTVIDKYNNTAPNLLLFMGTNNFPTATGAHHTVLSDLVPGHSVGEILYKQGECKLKAWIESHSIDTNGNINPITAIGQSMGGSLAIITHLKNSIRVRAKAYNPPALLSKHKRNYNLQDALTNPIIIYTQKEDPIFQIGNWLPENSIIYKISSDVGDKLSYLAKHKDCFASHRNETNLNFIRINPEQENQRLSRIITTLLWQALCIPAFLVNCMIMVVKAIINTIASLITHAAQSIDKRIISTARKPLTPRYSKMKKNLDNTPRMGPIVLRAC